MNAAQPCCETAPANLMPLGFRLLLCGSWLIVACAGCASQSGDPHACPCATYTPTRWYCWDGGPLAYSCCRPPVQSLPVQSLPPANVSPRYDLTPPNPVGPAPEPVPDAPPQSSVRPPEQSESGIYSANRYLSLADGSFKTNAADEASRGSSDDFTAPLITPYVFRATFAGQTTSTDVRSFVPDKGHN